MHFDVLQPPTRLTASAPDAQSLRRYEVAVASGFTTMSARVLSTIAFNSACSCAGILNLSSVCCKSSINASHSGPVIFMSLCDSYMERPVYFCGPPVAQQTISVTRYLNPGGGTRW